ncbi:hypothetical protein RMATCC62417_15470 [Rhizopus microsporus]|nr:hypothetical protein RMATCC62417_15470 [Rhizopus microsporus]
MSKCFCYCETVKNSHSYSPEVDQTLLSRALKAFSRRKNQVGVVLLEREESSAVLPEVEESLTQCFVDLNVSRSIVVSHSIHTVHPSEVCIPVVSAMTRREMYQTTSWRSASILRLYLIHTRC